MALEKEMEKKYTGWLTGKRTGEGQPSMEKILAKMVAEIEDFEDIDKFNKRPVFRPKKGEVAE